MKPLIRRARVAPGQPAMPPMGRGMKTTTVGADANRLHRNVEVESRSGIRCGQGLDAVVPKILAILGTRTHVKPVILRQGYRCRHAACTVRTGRRAVPFGQFMARYALELPMHS